MKPTILLLLFFTAVGAKAATQPNELEQYFGSELQKVNALASQEPIFGSGPGKSFPIQDINVDVSPSVSFGVSNFLNLTISPEIDFVLQPER